MDVIQCANYLQCSTQDLFDKAARLYFSRADTKKDFYEWVQQGVVPLYARQYCQLVASQRAVSLI